MTVSFLSKKTVLFCSQQKVREKRMARSGGQGELQLFDTIRMSVREGGGEGGE